MKKILFVVTATIFLLVACGAPVAIQSAATDTPIPLPATTKPTCGTVVTMIDENPPVKFGETNIAIEFIDYNYRGTVAGGGFIQPSDGAIKDHIGGKNVTLTRNDFSEGFIHTEKFGNIEVLFAANVLQECILLVATPNGNTNNRLASVGCVFLSLLKIKLSLESCHVGGSVFFQSASCVHRAAEQSVQWTVGIRRSVLNSHSYSHS